LILRASSASWAAEVAWCECIRLGSGDGSRCHWVTGRLFIGVVGSMFWSLVRRFLLPGGLQTASRMSWMSCWTWESCIVISSIAVEEAMVSGQGGAEMMVFSSSFFIRASTAALRAAVSSLDAR
jgi:hypothetical protein